MKRTLTLGAAALCAAAAFAARPLEWQNLDAAHHLAGRMASSGYLRGKVIYVDCRDYGDEASAESIRRMEEAWQTFKMKPFVMIGSHRGAAGAEKIKQVAKTLGLTYPIYADAGVARTPEQEEADTQKVGFVYVVECTGRIVYRGKDDRRAFGVVASALMAMSSPLTPKQWKHYLDFYVDVLPGRAVIELEEYRRKFPKESQAYDAVWRKFNDDPEVMRVTKLERLTRQAKDYDFKDSSARRLSAEKVNQAIASFSDLKTSKNPAVAQEAKNCIAELTWTAAMLKDE